MFYEIIANGVFRGKSRELACPARGGGFLSPCRPTVILRRLLILVYLLLFVSVAAGSATFFWQTRAEYLRLKEIEAQSRERLDVAQKRLAEQERTLERLRTDPAYVEMVIRRRLGYAREDEQIFRFEP